MYEFDNAICSFSSLAQIQYIFFQCKICDMFANTLYLFQYILYTVFGEDEDWVATGCEEYFPPDVTCPSSPHCTKTDE